MTMSKAEARAFVAETIPRYPKVKKEMVAKASTLDRIPFMAEYLRQWAHVQRHLKRPDLGKDDAKVILAQGWLMVQKGLLK